MNFEEKYKKEKEKVEILERMIEDQTRDLYQKGIQLLENEKLRLEKHAALKTVKMKDIFLANVSHEMRTPLNGILGMSYLLSKSKLNDEQKELLEALTISGENLLAIINDILDISKIEAGKMTFENINFNINDILKNTIRILSFKAKEKFNQINYIIEQGVPESLNGDPARLNQILLNLIGNSIKFTEKGKVDIAISALELNNDTQTIQFSVADNGIGIPEDKLNNLFKRFSQLDESTTRKYGGTGLGLFITKQFIELQGGRIWVESEVNKGTTFTFTIPFKIVDEEKLLGEGSETEKELTLNSASLKILLVEDNPINQLFAKKVILRLKCIPDMAENGKIAIKKLSDSDYDLILMDLQMPELDGYETTEYIRNKMNSTKSKVPVIAMSANACTNQEVEKCLSLGMNDYISKPFTQNDLIEKINKLGLIKIKGKNKHTNLSYLNELADGNNEFVVEMLEMFLNKTPKLVDDLHKHHVSSDWESLKSVAHSMKPSFSFMGIKELEADIKTIENNAMLRKNLDQIPELLAKLRKICDESYPELKQELEIHKSKAAKNNTI